MSPGLRRGLVVAAKLAVTLAVLGWLAAATDLRAAGAALAHADPLLLAAGLGATGWAYPLLARRLAGLLAAQGAGRPFGVVHRVVWVGQFFSGLLPGAAGGDVAKLASLWRDPTARGPVLAAVLLDRLAGLVVLFVIGAVAWLLLPRNGDATPWLPPALLLAAALAAFSLALALPRLTRLPWPQAWRRWLTPAERSPAGGATGLTAALGWSVLVWLADLTGGWLLARAVGLPLDWPAAAAVLAVAQAAAVLPVSVGGHGVREGVLVALAAQLPVLAGTGSAPALAAWAALVLGTQLLWSAVGGFVFLRGRLASSPS